MNQISYKIKNLLTLFGAVMPLMLLYSCDTLESDVKPDQPKVELEGAKVYSMANGSAVIDLYAMVKTQGTVRLDIMSQPKNGSLTELRKGLMQYSPSQNFKRGSDSFKFSVYSDNNTLLKQDSVLIVVDSDSTNLPCGIYPENDNVQAETGEMIIDVLQNDFLCGELTQFLVEIYRPEAHYPPYNGSAVVVSGNKVKYTPGNSFPGYDKFMYRVYNINDTSVAGYGFVYIDHAPINPCTWDLLNDTYNFTIDSLQSDTLHLDILSNDVFCDSLVHHNYSINITSGAQYGTAYFDGLLNYLPNASSQTFTDSIAYQICYDELCKTAKVYIKVD
jgi:hypothetical protein